MGSKNAVTPESVLAQTKRIAGSGDEIVWLTVHWNRFSREFDGVSEKPYILPMDLVYTTVWETEKKSERDVCGKVKVSWSHRNLIAFTSGYKKTQDTNDNILHVLAVEQSLSNNGGQTCSSVLPKLYSITVVELFVVLVFYVPLCARLRNTQKSVRLVSSGGYLENRTTCLFHYPSTPRSKRFYSSRLSYYSNSFATFQLKRLVRSGDTRISLNPGPDGIRCYLQNVKSLKAVVADGDSFGSKTALLQDIAYGKCLYNAIHILDPDTPWDVCSFDSHHKELIQKIIWDSTGARLLSIDLQGHCNVWTMKDNLVNDWRLATTANVGEGERLVAVSWIDNGIKVMFSPSSSEDHVNKRSFEEQFKSSSNKPPYTEFGGKAQNGWVSVTESGLFCVTTIKPDVKIARQNLSSIRRRVAFADLAYTSQGKVIVAANDGEKSTSVQFYRVQIKSQNNTCQIETFSLPCLFPHDRNELQENKQIEEYRNISSFPEGEVYYNVSDIQFVSKNSGEVVLVCTVGPFGTCIKRWVMRKERIEKFQRIPFRTAVQPTVFRWSCLSSHKDGASLLSLALPRLPCTVDVSQALFPVLAIAASYDDGRIELLNSHSLQPMSSHQHQAKGLQTSEPPTKKAKTLQPLTQTHGAMYSMCLSPCCCCLVGVSCTGDLSVFKIQPTEGTSPNRFKRSLVDLLEYCLVAGWEWWDIVVAAHLGSPADMAEMVLKQLLEDFNQVQLLQHQHTPHMLIPKMMAVKASLYRCIKDGSGQAMDCYASQFLYSVTMLLRSLPSCTQNTMEQLTKVCTARITDVEHIDKVILSLDGKGLEYTVEPGILTAVHPLIQWITDLAMFIIAAFTTRHTKDSVPGVSLGRKPEVLGLLKEMLVLIRIWGQTMPSIVPSITPSADKKDSLALLFKIISKMWLHSKQPGEGQEIEDRLAVEASPLLPNQLFVVNMKAPNLNRGVIGKPITGPIKASVYQFNNRPMGASVCHSYHPFASAILPIAPESAYNLDVIRRVFIDSRPDMPLKQCTRCSCLSQLDGPSNQNVVLKTWEQRWVKSCVCGGSWKKYRAPETA